MRSDIKYGIMRRRARSSWSNPGNMVKIWSKYGQNTAAQAHSQLVETIKIELTEGVKALQKGLTQVRCCVRSNKYVYICF